MWWSGWSWFFHWFSVLPVAFLSSSVLFQSPQQQLMLVSLSPSSSIAFSALWQGPGIYPAFLPSFTFTLWSVGKTKFTGWQVLFFSLIKTIPDLLAWISLFISQSPREFYAFHFQGQILVCAYIIYYKVKFKFLHNSQWISFPTLWCLFVFPSCARIWN